MNLNEVFRELRSRNETVPRPLRLPTLSEVDMAEQRLGTCFHSDYRRYLLEVSDVVYGTLEPCIITRPESRTDLLETARTAWDAWGVPRHLLPICEDNADFYCINSAGEIMYWSHNGVTSEKWPDLATWIKEVWLDENNAV
jgi:hypothetical protein